MRTTVAFAALLITSSACGLPCRDRNLAVIGTGGPVGILIAALDRCDDDPPAMAEATEVPEAAQTDPAPLPDMATTPATDMATQADMAAPPDLRRSPEVFDLVLSGWQPSGGLTATSATAYRCAAGFDFAAGRAVPCILEVPLRLPADAAAARTITLTYRVAARLAWGPTSSYCDGQGLLDRYLARQGSTSACLQGGVGAGLVIDGSATSPLVGGRPPQLDVASPPGASYPVSAGSTLSLRLQVVGDVDLADLRAGVTVAMDF